MPGFHDVVHDFKRVRAIMERPEDLGIPRAERGPGELGGSLRLTDDRGQSGDLFDLTGRVAVVAGITSVLGLAMAEGLARHGARIVGIGRNPEKLERVRTELLKEGAEFHLLTADVTNRKALEQARDEASAWAGGGLDILLNTAGTNSQTPFFDVTDDEWDHILDTNLKSVWLACQVFGRTMVEQESGSIINISSVASERPLSRVSTYAVTKAGVDNLTKFLAREWGPYHVRVNAIVPGFFPAEQNRRLLTEERLANIHAHTPLGRLGRPEELQGTAVWLASRASEFVTGAIVRVDGGFSVTTF